MKFGMIGARTLSQAVAGHVVKAGHDVVFRNSRGAHTLGSAVEAFGSLASAGTVDEAGAADLVVLAVPWKDVREAPRSLPTREGGFLWTPQPVGKRDSLRRTAPRHRRQRVGRLVGSRVTCHQSLRQHARPLRRCRPRPKPATELGADPIHTQPKEHTS